MLVQQNIVSDERRVYQDALVLEEIIPFTIKFDTPPPLGHDYYTDEITVYFKKPRRVKPFALVFIEWFSQTKTLLPYNEITIAGTMGAWDPFATFKYRVYFDRCVIQAGAITVIDDIPGEVRLYKDKILGRQR